jgi:uncharacterized protein (DUF58 family)
VRSTDAPAGATLRSRGFVVVGAGTVLAIGALVLRSPSALIAAVPLLLAPLIALAARPADLATAEITWEAQGIGSELDLVGVARGRFGRYVSSLEVRAPPLPGATVRARPRFERTPKEIRFTLALALGEPTITTLDAPTVVWRDPWGLTEQTLVSARAPQPLERYPPELHRLGAIRLERTIPLPGESRSRRIGPTGEFFGVREAAPGEPPRQINWRASARIGRLLANDYQIDRTGDLLLLLDVRPTSLGRSVDERLLGVARAGVFGIAESLLRRKVRVGFASFGEFVQAVPLSTGRTHRVRIQQALLATERASAAGPPDRCTFGLRRYFRPGLTTLIVSAWDGEPSMNLLPYLQRGGYPAALVSPSPLTLGQRRADGTTVSEEERVVRRLERAERRARLGQLWQHGPVIDWTDLWSLEVLVRFLEQPSARRVV